MKPSTFLASALVCLSVACGNSPKNANPDATPPAPDATPPAPDASTLVDIGVGATMCKGHSDPAKQADIGPVIPDEIGDPATARITPPSYPFKVESISYQLTGMEATCGTNIAGAVTVYAAPTADTPPATAPSDAQKIQVAGSATDLRSRVVTETLDPPIVLQQGQDLFIDVEMDVNTAQTVSLCLDGCPIPADDKRQFWSEQASPPHTWSTLYSFGIATDYAVWATGEKQ